MTGLTSWISSTSCSSTIRCRENRSIKIAIIPARYASTRFPGKPLASICGRPMIYWVYQQTLKVDVLDRVLVATDDDRIAAAVREFGGEVIMTSPDHTCGTDRLAEVARGLPDADIIVNVQGDEPLIAPESIDLVERRLDEAPGASMSTLMARCPEDGFNDPNVVKVVVDSAGFALYFSRSRIPYPRSQDAPAWKHIGLYAYRRDFLLQFSAMAPTPLEQAESLEQLRALENGFRIACAVSPYDSVGVDTPADIARVEAILSRQF